MVRIRTNFALVLCSALACSEPREPMTVDSGTTMDVIAPSDTVRPDMGAPEVVPPEASVGPDVVPPEASVGPDTMPAVGRLVINEIRAADEEWVEFYNAGTAPVDLSNVRVADSESDGGARLSRAMSFPPGVMLAPGQYLLLSINRSDAGTGPQTACVDGGPSTCFHASWGLSASRGETVHVLSPTGEPLVAETYPPDAAAPGQSWGRLPNGTGAFAPNRPTPGAPNAAP